MTEPALLAFLSWARQGVAAATGPDPLTGPLSSAAGVRLTYRVNTRPDRPLTIRTHGPGDVAALDPRQVIRTDPRPGDDTFPPHLFPLVELDRPELPWLLTPADPADRDRLRPWLVLVVVEQARSELVSSAAVTGGGTPDAGGSLPTLRAQVEDLPDLSESHLWAHVQVTLDGALDDARLDRLLRDAPARTCARLVCPRRLQPRRAYLACLVPAFEAGRKTGLGLPLTDDDLATVRPAWQPGTGDAPPLPVYHHWEFATGEAGSFEALVDRLQGRPLPRSVGVMPVDVAHAGPGMPSLPTDHPGAVVELEGALRSSGTFAAPWDGGTRAAFEAALRARVEPGPDTADLTVPVYGLGHSGRSAFTGDADRVTWLRQLNLDPRYRAVAALGTRAVQDHQEDLVAAAWEQVAQVTELNRALRQAQLGRTADQAVYDRRVARDRPGVPLPDDRLLQVTAPVHAGIGTAARLARGRSLGAVTSAGFRKLTRPGGSLARIAGPAVTRPLPRLAALDLDPAPPPPTPPGIAAVEALSTGESVRALTADRVKLPPWAAPPTGPTEAPVPADPRVDAPGAAMPNRVFTTTTDGRVMSRVAQAGRGAWLDHGTPPGTTATSAPVAVRDLYAYVAGADGQVHRLAWDGDAWIWQSSPLPGGRRLSADGSLWGTWADYMPVGDDLVQSGTYSMLWAVTADGRLFQLNRAGGWVDHGNPGTPLAGQPGAVDPWQLLIRARDGRLFVYDRNSGSWVWRNLGGSSATGQPFALGDFRGVVREDRAVYLSHTLFTAWLKVRDGVSAALGAVPNGVVYATTTGQVICLRLSANGLAFETWLNPPPGLAGGQPLRATVLTDHTTVAAGVAGRYLEGRSGAGWTDLGPPLPAGAGAPTAVPPRNRRWRARLGYMSSLVVAHVDAAAGGDRVHPRLGSDLGFDAEVRGGWALRDPMPGTTGTGTQGIGIALADVRGRGGDAPRRDLVTLWVQQAGNGGNYPRWRVGWDVDATGTPASWSAVKQSPTPVATTITSGGALTARTWVRDCDVDVADLDGDGRPELVLAYVTADNPPRAFYRVGWGVDANGDTTQGWSESRPLPAAGGTVVGIGVAVLDTTSQFRPDLVVLYVTQTGAGLQASYRIGSGINARGTVTGGWSAPFPVGGGPLPAAIQGASLTAADFSGSEMPDLVVLLVENGPTDNVGRYRVGWDVSPGTGQPRRWSGDQQVPGWWGWENRGAGVAVGDVDPALVTRKKAFATAFTDAATAHQRVLAAAQRLSVAADAEVPLAPLAGDTRAALEPGPRVERRTDDVVTGVDLLSVRSSDRLNPVLAAPSFPLPACELVRDISRDYLLPGADGVPPDTVSLLRGTPAFVEAFMVGLNHEMARELLWRELPADRTATFFRTFWDRTSGAPDLPPIGTWNAAAALGESATGMGGPDMAVLVVRGELLRRHPNTVVSAIHATLGADGRRHLGDLTRQPDFRGTMPPDLTFFGFPFTVAEARGMGGDPGWFFAFAEHPTEPRFGLDEPGATPHYGEPPAAWDDLDWARIAQDEGTLGRLGHVPAELPFSRSTELPLRDDTTGSERYRWGENAAHTAHITLQRPVLFAIHATDLLAHTSGDWHVTHVVRGRHRSILALAGQHPDGRWWRLGRSEAIAALRARERLYVQLPGGVRAEVVAVRGRGGTEYLRTRAGGGLGNNLTALPDLPPGVVVADA